MTGGRTIDSIPIAHTPPGGWTEWPPPVLAGCDEPLPPDAPDIRGLWQVVEVHVGGEPVDDHPSLGQISRVEQAGDRITITGSGVIHDMRCDGTLANGVHDVAAADYKTEVHVVATYEDGAHVLRPDGLPIEVRRWREDEYLLWDYASFVARMRRLADAEADPAQIVPPPEDGR
ncbi:MAG: hypothetical protein ACR2QK_13585 [Acidimicrobiales bacterium]